MLAKGITFSIFTAGVFHPIPSITVFKLSGTKWGVEKCTSHDSTVPVEQFAPTIRDDGTLTLTIASYDEANSTHALLKALSLSQASALFKIDYPNSSLGSFEFGAYVTSFGLDTPVDGLLKGQIVLTSSGGITHQSAKLLSAVFTDTFAGHYVTGNLMKLTATYDEVVKVTGVPKFNMTVTTGAMPLSYTSGTGTNLLVFTHTVVAGDVSAAGSVVATSPLELNSGTILDMAGQPASLIFTPPDVSGITIN